MLLIHPTRNFTGELENNW